MVGPSFRAQDEGRRRVTSRVLRRVYLRGLLVQAGFNPRTLQGPGWAFALSPALFFLHRDAAELEAAMRRHLGHFNSHPYLASALLGGAVRLEERIASGLAPAASLDAFRRSLASPLAAVGDAFFWSALRPVCALVALLTVPVLGPWAVAVFLVAYNLVQLMVRSWAFLVGYREAEGLVEAVGRLHLPLFTLWLRRLAAALAGGVGVTVALVAGRAGGLTPLGLVASGALLTLMLTGRVRGWQVAVALLGAGFLLGFVL